MKYWTNIFTALHTTIEGLLLTWKYLWMARRGRNKKWVDQKKYFDDQDATFTVQYPKEKIPVPDHGRYQLHNAIEDCIVCDKCAKICPVDCIEIESIKDTEVYGHTSNHTPLRLHASKFDIDMSKCFFCGLCTVVCPTECLIMTKNYEYSSSDLATHTFSFSKLTEEKKKKIHVKVEKQNKSGTKENKQGNSNIPKMIKPKPIFKPKIATKKKS